MLISLPHLSPVHTRPRLAKFLSPSLVFILALIFTPVASVSAVTKAEILEDLRSAAATYESNQNNGIVKDDEPDPSSSTPASDAYSINIEGHILLIATSIAVIAGAGTILIITRKKPTA